MENRKKGCFAKIVGKDAKYGFKREFVDCEDYNVSERYYELGAGIYEVCNAGERSFIRIVGGKIKNISKDAVLV